MNKFNILLVDDVEENIYSLKMIIEDSFNVNIFSALSAMEAMQIVLNNNIDLILSDIQMPEINGFEFADYLKGMDKTKDIPIIFITGIYDKDEYQEKGYSLGAVDYITKPIDDKLLTAKLKVYIELHTKTALLMNLNNTLEEKIAIEVKKNQKKEQAMVAQSRLAQMGEMISMIAHQWRQPLGAINSTTMNMKLQIELENYNLDNKEEQESFLKFLLNEIHDINGFVDNLTTTIDDFRNFYKPDKKSICDLVEIPIIKSLGIIKASLESNNIQLDINYNSKQKIEMYDSELMQVFLNLFQNSQDNFIDNKDNIKEKIITISTMDKDNNVIVKITDNGGGISGEIISKIFDPYFSTKNEKNGTGLGLYMSKTIIEDHHKGKIEVINVDNGVSFIITLNTREIKVSL